MNKFKYPRTPHLPWSPGHTKDDIINLSADKFVGKEVIVTEKMDGENTTLYRNFLHARSIDSQYHPSRNWVKQFHSSFAYKIPENWRICGENLYAQHALRYEGLPSYFMAFSIWDSSNQCLSWDESLKWFRDLNIEYPRVLFSGLWNEDTIRSIEIDTDLHEGYVVRIAENFDYSEFSKSVPNGFESHMLQMKNTGQSPKLFPMD